MGTHEAGYRHANSKDSGSRIRVRGKRLDQVDETKLTLAYWLLAKQLVADKTNPRLPTEAEVTDRAKAMSDDEAQARARELWPNE
jgi:hypothetical protein